MALDLPRQDLIAILSSGQIDLTGQFTWGSNHTFLAEVSTDTHKLPAVYKPAAGERPLWDFPAKTLAQREVAAYFCSQALGWELVPPTVLRQDGPAGGGSLQLFLEIDPERHYFSFSPQERRQLGPAALFDVLINNADRKAGHVLLAPDGHIWLIDHGVCFHQEYKLRTVIWDFSGQPIAPELLDDLARFAAGLAGIRPAVDSGTGSSTATAVSTGSELAPLCQLLSPAENEALLQRAQQLLEQRCYPAPGPDRHLPWPLI